MSTELTGFTTTARLFHWLVACLVLLMIAAGLTMVQQGLPRPVQNSLYVFHKNTGVIILFIMLARLIYRLRNPYPPLPEMPALQRLAAEANHIALYVLIFMMPLSGYIRVRAGRYPIEWIDKLGLPILIPKSKPLEEVAQAIHYYCAMILIAAILMHIGAALYHGIWRRDGLLGRVWPPVQR
ncbi:cytochrome b [Qingshengfaniella alkalisoli]|uniref:Cytochrome b n=1 Tax=Qingshengfaniella alkalisoli TaxID=2599296 RepID=A0A5B8IAJ2_9RHOB|nr:cytochrome b [Qingshengfaniella alkalisoli]QDY71099.1 cytochrome b [Qingshengfaniella alkalisoli]